MTMTKVTEYISSDVERAHLRWRRGLDAALADTFPPAIRWRSQ